MQESPPVPLNYALPKRNWWKRALRVLFALIVLSITCASWRWGPYVWHQSQILYWQHQCMNFATPPDKIVYEEDSASAARLLNQPGYSPVSLLRGVNANGEGIPVEVAEFYPSCLLNLTEQVSALSAGYYSPAPRGVGAVLFLHELTSASGSRRMVSLVYLPHWQGFSRRFIAGINCNAGVTIPARWNTLPRNVQMFGFVNGAVGNTARAPQIRIYAGQIDPKDLSHFTVRYQMWDQEDVLDGRLRDNDDVTLTARHVPKGPGK